MSPQCSKAQLQEKQIWQGAKSTTRGIHSVPLTAILGDNKVSTNYTFSANTSLTLNMALKLLTHVKPINYAPSNYLFYVWNKRAYEVPLFLRNVLWSSDRYQDDKLCNKVYSRIDEESLIFLDFRTYKKKKNFIAINRRVLLPTNWNHHFNVKLQYLLILVYINCLTQNHDPN